MDIVQRLMTSQEWNHAVNNGAASKIEEYLLKQAGVNVRGNLPRVRIGVYTFVLCVCVRACVRVCMHTCIHTYIHTYIHVSGVVQNMDYAERVCLVDWREYIAYTYTYVHTYTCTYMQKYLHTCVCVHIYVYIYIYCYVRCGAKHGLC
jgi:hypothetical protein